MEFKLKEQTLGQLLTEAVAKNPNQDALVFPDRDHRLTWQEFSDEVDALAKGLMAMGVKKDEKVAIWASNVPQWVSLMFATARIGAVLITVNTSYRDTELKYLLEQSQTENLCIIEGVRDHDFISTVYTIIPELKTQSRNELNITDLPHLKRVIFLGQENHRGMFTINEIMALAPQTSDDDYKNRQASLDPHDVINMQYTSGTTGFPKGVMLTHAGILNNGYWIGENQKLSEVDKVCIPVPLFHCFGCVLGVLACVSHASTMVIIENFSPVAVMTAIDHEKCTAVYGVPSMYLSILEHKLFPKFNYSSLRTGIMSGAVCPEPLMRRVFDELNMKEITIPYGLTEGSPVMTMTKTDETIERRCGSVGRAMPGIEVEIFDPETGEKLGPNQTGEVCCRGYNVMRGYYNMPKETEFAIDKDGWLHSGDLGEMDEHGYLRITGRLKDMILRGGENIYPREVEEYLLKMPGVYDVQVVGVPSRKYGEEVCAFIITKPDYEVRIEDIRDFCRGKIAWHKIPRHISIVDKYPMTASGKIQKYKLREAASVLFSHLA